MFKTKNRKPVKFILQLTAMVLIMLLLASCSGNIPSIKEESDDGRKPGVEAQSDEQQNAASDTPGAPATAAESYGNYIKAKGELITILTDALANNPGTELDSMSLIGVTMVDMALLPASSFGLGHEAAITTLGLLGAEDVVYSENGNQYSVKYRNAEGKQFELQGVYDKAADALKCTSFTEGKEDLISEYRKTSFGYVGQVYVIGEDGSTYVYQLAVSGKDGAVGISEVSAKPSALTGNETIDFPKQCKEWYAIKGNDFTGVTSDGRELSFVYTPSEDGE
ncbi:MAG TPA: hypothetical protein GXZ32_02870 [Clostridiales bacterium]|nr:hypothetical protein [Clostridiales bacterium]